MSIKNRRHTVKITITGPGGVIDNEAILIRDLLESKGASVTVVGTMDQDKEKPWRDCQGMECEIDVRGQPWGG